MITVHAITFWGICLVAVLGLLRAAWDLFSADKEHVDKHKGWARSQTPEPPEGFKWVLVRKEDLPAD